MCVTHLPQVAGCGHQQLFVAKQTKGGKTETHMHRLDNEQRVGELARLLGGSEITASTLANAKELLIAAQTKDHNEHFCCSFCHKFATKLKIMV